jgi:hypothetical protein
MKNSLLPLKNSLFFKIFSLLICVGNCAKSDCSATVSCYKIGLRSPEFAKFPVKFPDSREIARRRVRSALQPQPGSPASGRASPGNARMGRKCRRFARSARPPTSRLCFADHPAARCPLLRNGFTAISFSCLTRVSPLCDDLPEFRCKLVAVTSQPLIKRTIRPVGRLLSHFLVLRGFALVLLQFRLKITHHGATPPDATRARMVAWRSGRNDD